MRISREERFMRRVAKQPDGCWLWTAHRDRYGYGVFAWTRTDLRRAHRASYELFVGRIPEGLQLDHLCRTRACVNPGHLEPVTNAENQRRGEPATKTHCVNGHEFTPENTYLRRGSKGGARDCRACVRERRRRYVARKAAA